MGLDSYLYKRDKNKKEVSSKDDVYFQHEEAFIYWRKANQIHNWFVQNVQKGVDDCNEHQVQPTDLIKLYDKLILARLGRDETLFPPTEGFFFGGVEIDDYYWQTLLRTIADIKKEVDTLKELRDNNKLDEAEFTYYYQSSW